MANKLISTSADLQVKVRNINLYQESLATLKFIEKTIKDYGINIHVISGDLFEYATPNDDERKLIYNHLVRLLNIQSLETLIIIDGNHDLEKENKARLTSGNNALSTIASIINTLDSPFKNKLKYLKTSTRLTIDNIDFIPYCLTNRENWGELKNYYEINNPKNLRIALYHAMIADYAKDKGLPIKLEKLDTLDIFPSNTVVMAGDIHESYNVEDKERNVKFFYPGAPMIHTFGEGSYIYIGEQLKPKYGKVKKFNIFKVDNNMQVATEMQLAEIPIPYYVQYLTIQLDSSIDYNVLKYNLQQIDWSRLCSENTFRLFIKVKSSNILIKQEREIFDILKSMTPISDVTIQFEYDKLIQKDTYIENPVVKEIIETKLSDDKIQINNDAVITTKNIDDLLLNRDQLTQLFDSSCKSVLTKVDASNISEIREDILNLFKKQLEICIEQSSQRFNVSFKRVKCNNFMILGDVDINLSETGINRILGTNGIGKTTLYRLIRWILTGTIMEGMKSNQVVQNNLLVFNKNLPDRNFVEGELELVINDYKIVITRTVSRTWKKGVTEEQQLSQDWTDYISDTHRDIVLQLFVDSENEPKRFVGDNAEILIKKYFGNTIDNLLFIDQAKIKQILTTPANQLNELILDYIGVDYLKKLEANLDGVKEDLMSIGKPKTNKEILRENIIDTQIKIDNTTKESVELTEHGESLNTNIEENKSKLSEINKELENIGNVKSQIQDKENQQNKLKQIIDEFENNKPERKEKPEFTCKKPELNQEEIDIYKNSINNYNEKRKALSKQQDNVMQELRTFEQKLNQYHAICNNGFISRLNEINKVQEELKNNFTKIIDSIRNKLSETLQQLNNKFQEKYQKKLDLLNLQKIADNKISEIEEQIKNGYCPACKRKLDNFTDEHVKELQSQIDKLFESKKNIQSDINELNSWFEKFNIIKDKYTEYYTKCGWTTLLEFKNSDVKGFDKEIEELENIQAHYSSIEFEKESIQNKQKEFNIEFNKLLNDSDYNLPDNLMNDELTEIITIIRQCKSGNTNLREQIQKNIRESTQIQEYIDNIKNKYTDAFEKYEKLYSKWQQECDDIDSYNNQIQEQLNNHTQNKLKLLDILDEIKYLEKNQLPIYNKYKESQQSIEILMTNLISEKDQNIQEVNRLNLLINSYQNTLKNKQQEYDDLLVYEKNQIIWKVYSKLVKTNFKEIVFEYYRTFLNNTLNHLLSDVSFKLYWNNDSRLTMINQKDGIVTYQPVQLSSGMETTFLGLSLIYCMHILNVKNSVSHLFIDEISGTLNKGKELSYVAENYQELFVKILHKFTDKSIFLVDHSIDNIPDCNIYEVMPQNKYSIYERRN